MPPPTPTTDSPSTGPQGFRSVGLPAAAIGLIALVVVAYQPAFRAGFIWDDDAHITENRTLRSPDGLRRIWLEPSATPQYYPLVHTTFWIEHRLWGLEPAGYHAVNIALHAVDAVLLWLVLRRLNVPGAWIAAALFAVHPLQVESVAWITERKNVLSLLFYLAALRAWFGVFPPDATITSPPRLGRRYAWVLVLFTAALLSKTVTCSLPATLLLIAWWKRGRITRTEVLATLPLFALGMAFGLTTAYLERTHVGASGSEWNFTLFERVLIAGRALWFYVQQLLWPSAPTFIYPRWNVTAAESWQFLYPFWAVAALFALWTACERWGRGPFAAALFFVGTLVPALGFFNVYPMRYSFVADHFQYAAGIGLIVLAVAAVDAALLRMAPRYRKQIGVVSAAVVLVAFVVQTRRQTHVYQDSFTLWTDTVAKNPDGWMPNYSLANEYFKRNRLTEAVDYYERSLRLNPGNHEAHLTLGATLERQAERNPANARQLLDAREHYLAALQLQPNDLHARNLFGLASLKTNQIDQAAEAFRQVIAADPKNAEGQNNLGIIYELTGRRAEAAAQYQLAVELDPKYPEAKYNLANCRTAERKWTEAQQLYEEALALKPQLFDARNNLAGLWLLQAEQAPTAADPATRRGFLEKAVAEYQAWLALDPENLVALQNLAGAWERLEKRDEAVATLQRALKLNPDDPSLRDRIHRLQSRP